MAKHNEQTLDRVYENLTASVDRFGELLLVDEKLVSPAMRSQALLRRLSICFLVLYEYLKEKAQVPKELIEKTLDEVADHIIKQGHLAQDDKEQFLKLASIYSSIRWSAPGHGPNIKMIMNEVAPMYAFLKRVTNKETVAPQKEVQKEATP